MAKKVGLERN